MGRLLLLPCGLCEASLETYPSLDCHLDYVHKPRASHKCPGCDLRFSSRGRVLEHAAKCKSNGRSGSHLSCKLCGKEARSIGVLLNHFASEHLDELVVEHRVTDFNCDKEAGKPVFRSVKVEQIQGERKGTFNDNLETVERASRGNQNDGPVDEASKEKVTDTDEDGYEEEFDSPEELSNDASDSENEDEQGEDIKEEIDEPALFGCKHCAFQDENLASVLEHQKLEHPEGTTDETKALSTGRDANGGHSWQWKSFRRSKQR